MNNNVKISVKTVQDIITVRKMNHGLTTNAVSWKNEER